MIDCCGRNKLYMILWCGSNKSDGLHNKGSYHKGQYKVTFFCIKILCINPKRAWQPLLPSAKGLSFIIIFYLMQESRWSSPFFLFYPLASSACWKEHYIYIYLIGCGGAWIIIIDITLEVKGCGGKNYKPYLSLCPIKTL